MDERIDSNRRNALKKIGGIAAAGFVSSTTGSANHGNCSGYGGDHWRAGAVLDCFFSYHTEFDLIYNDIKNYENSFVTLAHDDWDGDIRIRFGSIDRKSNTDIQNTWQYYYTDGGGSQLLGDDRQIMVGGDFGTDEHNRWSWNNHIGRINDRRCAGQDSAMKYWYHEVGHGHLLGHTSTSGDLMNSNELVGMRMDSGETAHWFNIYSGPQGDCDGLSHSHAATVPDRAKVSEKVKKDIEPPEAVEIIPLSEEEMPPKPDAPPYNN